MKTFTDNAGRVWTLAINVDSVRRVRSTLDVNLLNVVNGELIEQLRDDPILLCDVIYVLCQPQAEAAGVTDEQFGQAMAGDAIDAATTALLEELVAFFRRGRRQLLAKALDRLSEVETKAIQLAKGRLDDPAIEQRILDSMTENDSPVTTPGD